MIAFASFVEESDVNFSQNFSNWLKARTEMWTWVPLSMLVPTPLLTGSLPFSSQITFLRKQRGSRLNVFAPVNDLSSLSKSGSTTRSFLPGKKNDVAIAGGQIFGDEYSDHVVKVVKAFVLSCSRLTLSYSTGVVLSCEKGMLSVARNVTYCSGIVISTLLKSDQWLRESHLETDIKGAINFRQIPGTEIYALGQPTLEAIDDVLLKIQNNHPNASKIVWITLREEPIVYINGTPYCLRRENYSLRNMKDYGGISASRLEILEERLKEDVIAELNSFGGW
jgi:hypothetical protein